MPRRDKLAGVIDIDGADLRSNSGTAMSECLLIGPIRNHLVNVVAILTAESGGKWEVAEQ